jgi:hypothetical protein
LGHLLTRFGEHPLIELGDHSRIKHQQDESIWRMTPAGKRHDAKAWLSSCIIWDW